MKLRNPLVLGTSLIARLMVASDALAIVREALVILLLFFMG